MLQPDFVQKLNLTSTDRSRYLYSKHSAFESYYIDQSQFLTTFQRKLLLESLEGNLRPEYRRRIEIMLLTDMGYSQAQICTALGCSQETARHWMAMAQAGQAHKWNVPPIGRPKTIDVCYLNRLKELVSHSPREYGYSFQCWTAQWLSKHLAQEFGIQVSDRHINRLLKKIGLSTRQRREIVEKAADSTQDASITISDLQSSLMPGSLWSFDPIKTNN